LMSWAWRTFWRAVWNLSELSGIGLGRFAPWVLAQALGSRGEKQ
jgi:hypothetical protein